MAETSLVYKNIFIYRAIIWALYGGKYKKRIRDVASFFLDADTNVLELCFGDTILAEICRSQNRAWTGLDINDAFVLRAVALGFDATHMDIARAAALPAAQVCVMIGSLYHFHDDLMGIVRKMHTAAPRIIISEPVHNLSSKRNFLGASARRSANAGKGHETFRFDADSLREMLTPVAQALQLRLSFHDNGRDMICVLDS
jgi:hypothetical protein